VILTDTVGFIHDLPKELVNAFRATLEEVADADLLIHLVDISDADYEDQIRSVKTIIGELRMNDKPQLLVFNKQDRLKPEQLTRRLRDREAIPICAQDANTTRPLLETMESHLWRLG
jgi:GTP-binding protein HflX